MGERSQMNFVKTGRLSVAQVLHAFLEREALPGTGISAAAFWSGLADLVRDFGQRNRQLLEVRDALQLRIDAYHRDRVGQPLDLSDYEGFLRETGYLLPQIDDFKIRTANVDDEIAHIAGRCAALERPLRAQCCECTFRSHMPHRGVTIFP